ncbi:hypothetical protein [Streptomyces sp. NPDC002088]|uniref:hypothetical protein n=1 Tax=Streptomyces sp. NPDC002088 TaxID=3154665 RepID=UPI00331998ED
MDQQEIHDRLTLDLAPHGWPPAPRINEGKPAAPGWKVFLYNGLGYAGLLWSEPDDGENAGEAGSRPLDDAAMRIMNLTSIHEALIKSGYTAELEIGVNDTPQIRITRVPA